MEKKERKEHVYDLRITERQARLLSYACDQFSRLICGQDWSFQNLMEAAWEKRCKEAIGGHGMDKEWCGGWYKMRQDAEQLCKEIKRRFWGLERNALYGVHYDDTADILFDIHQVIRHQLWLDTPEEMKSHITVDASEAMSFGSEPLAMIMHAVPKVEEESEEARTDVGSLSFTVRTVNCLHSARINTLEDLLRVKRRDLLKIRNFGKKSLRELDEFFERNGFTWGCEALLQIDDKEHPWRQDYYLPSRHGKEARNG